MASKRVNKIGTEIINTTGSRNGVIVISGMHPMYMFINYSKRLRRRRIKMKWILLSLIALNSSGCAFASLPSAKFTVHVTDAETGMPVTNAAVRTTFQHFYDAWGNKPDKIDRQIDSVDEKGYITFTGQSVETGLGCSVSADGYYSDWGGLERTQKNLALNRWEPWNPTLEVKMRPKKNPVPMVHRQVEWKFKIPQYNTPVGLDLERGDCAFPRI